MPLSQDQIRALQTHVTIPPGNVPGTVLTWNGPTDSDVDWTGPIDVPDVRNFTGDPNGVVFAPMGTLGVERDVPALWQNTDGVSAWTQVGAGGGTSEWTFAANSLNPTSTVIASIHQFFLEWGLSGRTRLIIFDDGGSALSQSIDFRTPGTYTLRTGGDLNEVVGGNYLCNTTGSVSIDGDGINLSTAGSSASSSFGGGSGDITIGGNTNTIGFYSAPAVAQAAHPTTLGDVITILTNLGLCA